jgi:hypothetical protein
MLSHAIKLPNRRMAQARELLRPVVLSRNEPSFVVARPYFPQNL